MHYIGAEIGVFTKIPIADIRTFDNNIGATPISVFWFFFAPVGDPASDLHSDPDDECNDFSDREMDTDGLCNYMDQDPYVPPTSSPNLGPYAKFSQTFLI